jgi:hypothetical protein
VREVHQRPDQVLCGQNVLVNLCDEQRRPNRIAPDWKGSIANLQPLLTNAWKVDARLWCGTFVDWAHPANDVPGARPPGLAVIVTCAVMTTSDSIWENGPYFNTTDIKYIVQPCPCPHPPQGLMRPSG